MYFIYGTKTYKNLNFSSPSLQNVRSFPTVVQNTPFLVRNVWGVKFRTKIPLRNKIINTLDYRISHPSPEQNYVLLSKISYSWNQRNTQPKAVNPHHPGWQSPALETTQSTAPCSPQIKFKPIAAPPPTWHWFCYHATLSF